ncbi:aspartate/glutamate racemase family protein [Aquimarina litoralis]|uniref:aspartate/glutamate racemase family protein n=1 Tax=Aquimarina litoralis TaxID=584605 RepID=UPI001C578790|nr:aspartate/glutamate racemase family protein [Aquimarina litoralis]MBW1298148.1 amino acid racemase [Aquimarina litoralis]
MKTIGLIGGMSWESSAIYYELLNKEVKNILGGYHSAKSVMVSVDFAEIETLQRKNDWQSLTQRMIEAAQQLEKSGADLVILCTNTMHLCSEAIIENTTIPFLHIADATGEKIQSQGLQKVALLGTKFTMEKDFYKTVLKNYNVQVLIPELDDREQIHQIIYNELVLGEINDTSREIFKKIIAKLKNEGAEGVILGCTEIPLLIKQSDVDIPIFNTTEIHAEKAVQNAVKN